VTAKTLDLTDSQYLLTNWVSEYSYTPLYLLDNTRHSYNLQFTHSALN